jgi:alpha-galactosidase
MTKIAFIGAGSVEFTKNLVGDLLAFPELRGVELALHDIDPDRLATAEAMVRWAAHRRDASPLVSAHAEREAALDGSDFVINIVQIGGHEATLRDFQIPARYGLRQTIADTLGIGGIFRTLRTADHMLALGREMAELCPATAWLLNYTNPMAMLCWLVYAGTPTQNVVGLCHSVQFTVEDLAALVGVPEDEVTYLSAGVNHQAFLLRFEREGEEPLPAAGRADRRRPGPATSRPRRSLPPAWLLPDRVQRARGRVRAVVHAPRTGARALPDPGGRVHPA